MSKLKKVLLMCTAYALVAAIAIGGTLAYFTDRDSAANVFTVGDVSIELNEKFEQGAELIPGVKIEKEVTVTNTGDNDAWVWMTYAIPSILDNTDANLNVIHVNTPGAYWYGYHTNPTFIASAGLTEAVDETDTWKVDYAVTKEVEIDGVMYNVYAHLYNGFLTAGETTNPGMNTVYLDSHVDIDPDGNMAWVEDGVAKDLNWNVNTNGNPVIYVSAYGIQTDGFATVEEAYAAYNEQWGDNGAEYAQYKISYFSSLHSAITAINGGTIEESTDASKANAAVGIYTDDNGELCLVLLDDLSISERITPTINVTIDLNGYKLTCTDKVAIDTSKDSPVTITVDGRTEGSTIEVSETDGNARAIQAKSGSTVNVLGGTYIGISNGGNGSVIYAASGATLNVSAATVTATETTGTSRGFSISAGATANITDCTITATTDSAKAYGVYNSGATTITGCTINAYSNYGLNDNNLSQGVLNYYNAELTLIDCNVTGTHSGVQNAGTLTVNGGTYKGYAHGGFYFAGEGTTSYVRNAIITECDMPDGYISNGTDNNSGCYIGGHSNITVYMDNCYIYGSSQSIAIRGNSFEQNNTLYISNSTVNKEAIFRIGNENNLTNKVYLGVGNNFTAEDTNNPSCVIVTNETYAQN